jgi:hypothetical protein
MSKAGFSGVSGPLLRRAGAMRVYCQEFTVKLFIFSVYRISSTLK